MMEGMRLLDALRALPMLLLAPACHPAAMPIRITDPAQLASAVGKPVLLEGVVTNTRIATLLGCDVESESPDLRGQRAVAEGVVSREVITAEQIERAAAEGERIAHRGAGTFYRLTNPRTGRLVQVSPAARP